MENRNSYTEGLRLEVTIDKSEFQRIEEDFKKLHVGGLKKEDADALKKAYIEHQARLTQIRKIEDDLDKLRSLHTKEAKDAIKDLEKTKAQLLNKDSKTGSSTLDSINEMFKDKLSDMVSSLGRKLENFFSDIKTRAFQMMDEISAYSLNSRVYSSTATNLRLNYGMSGAQAYAAQMASQQTGFGSFDSYLTEQMFATKETREEWQKLYKQYEKSYEQDEKIALEFQSFKKDWTNLKNEIAQELIHFFMENKEVLKQAANAIIQIAKVIVSFFSWYISQFGPGISSDEARAAATNDIIESYVRTNNNSNISVNQTNHYNVDNNTARGLTEANNNEYLQIISSLTGGQ